MQAAQQQAAQQQAKAAKRAAARNAGAQGAVAGTAPGPLMLPGAAAPLPANGRHGARAAQGVPAG